MKLFLHLLGFICANCVLLTVCNPSGGVSNPENEPVAAFIKEQADKFKFDMVHKFMLRHSNRIRDLAGHVMDIELKTDSAVPERAIDSAGPFYTFRFQDKLFLIQKQGIFEVSRAYLSALSTGESSVSSNDVLLECRSCSDWSFHENERVLHGFEWGQFYYIVTTTGPLSSVYRLHESRLQPVYLQSIRNEGNAVAAEIFRYNDDLFMVIVNDQDNHDTTLSKLYSWQGSYMDEFDVIKTTGATAVKTFQIKSNQYIAIAQGEDATGNPKQGTVILKMTRRKTLEHLQLLPSVNARSLQYMRTVREHFLVIGQEKEESVVYWFRGPSFMYWQQLDNLQGKDLLLDGLHITSDNFILLAQDSSGPLQFFSRIESPTKITTDWLKTKERNVAGVGSGTAVMRGSVVDGMNVVVLGENFVFLTLVKHVPGQDAKSLTIYPLSFVKKELDEGGAADPVGEASQCLQTLEDKLNGAQSSLRRIEALSSQVLTTDSDIQFEGTIKTTVMKPAAALLLPTELHSRQKNSQNSDATNGKLLDLATMKTAIQDITGKLDETNNRMATLVYKSKPDNVITGNLRFTKHMELDELEGENLNLNFETLNGINREDFEKLAVRKQPSGVIQVSGKWITDALTAKSVQTTSEKSKFSSESFLLTESVQSQTLTGKHTFGELDLTEMELGEAANINGIQYSDIVLMDNSNKEIKGFKHVPTVRGSYTLETLNGIHHETWFSQVARVSGAENQHFTGPVQIRDGATVEVDHLNVKELNGKDWNGFKNNLMLDGQDQTVEGDLIAPAVTVDDLTATTISGFAVEEFIGPKRDQKITSIFLVDEIRALSLTCHDINGLNIEDSVHTNETLVEINSPVVLESFHVGNVTLPEAVTIADKDVSELEGMRKVHEYSTANGDPIILQGIDTNRLQAREINGHILDDIDTMYWDKSGNNLINVAQLVVDDRNVVVTDGNFKTDKLSHFTFPEEFVSLDNSLSTVVSKLTFMTPVTIKKDVRASDGVKIAGSDTSQMEKVLAGEKVTLRVPGTSIFHVPVTLYHPVTFAKLNGRDPGSDAIMLNSPEAQRIEGKVTFLSPNLYQDFKVADGNVEVLGLVEGANLSRVKENTAYTDKENVISGKVNFPDGINVENFLAEKADGMEVKKVTDNVIFLNSPKLQRIDANVQLQNGNAEFLTNSFCGVINGVPVRSYFGKVVRLDADKPVHISGTKIFKNATFDGTFVCKSVSGVDLQSLQKNGLSKSKPQEITGHWTLCQANMTGGVITPEIAGVAVNDVVFIDEPFTIGTDVILTNKDPQLRSTVDEGMERLNGFNIQQLVENGIQIKGATCLDEVEVGGNTNWSEDQQDVKGLNHFASNIVRKSEPQRITGEVKFLEGLESENLQTSQWLGGINFQEIQNDAIWKDSPDLVIFGSNEFTKPLQLENSSQPVTVSLLDTNVVNNIDLNKEAKDVVHVSESGQTPVWPFTGIIQLNGLILARKLDIKDTLGGVPAADIVVINDPRQIEQMQFARLSVEKSIDPDTTEGLDLKGLLNERISKTSPNQNVSGTFTLNQIAMKNCVMPKVNDVSVRNILRQPLISRARKTNNQNRSPSTIIRGRKTFKNLSINGKFLPGSINNNSVDEFMRNTVESHKPATITRPVIFQSDTIVNPKFNTIAVNQGQMQAMPNVMQKLTRVNRVSRVLRDNQSQRTRGEVDPNLHPELSERRIRPTVRSGYLDYIRMRKDLSLPEFVGQSRVNHVKVSPHGDILVSLHSPTSGEEKGLPKGCQCNSVRSLNLTHFLGNKEVVKTFGDDNCLNVYHAESENKVSYTVVSDTASSNASCFTDKDGTTQIFMGSTMLGDMPMGFISDVGVFSDADTDFLVLAEYYDPNKVTHSTVTRIMKVNRETGSLENVQNIDTHGARKVAVKQVNNECMLAIANSKGSTNEASCASVSAIYLWSKETSQFVLRRTVMTDGARDVQIITTNTASEFYSQTFVAFAQQGNAANGDVLVFKFENLERQFEMVQVFTSSWPVVGLKTSCMCGDCFLVSIVPQEGITFYEYRFVEGFQEYYRAPLFGVTDMTGFTNDDQHLFVIATTNGLLLAEAVFEGRC